MTTFTIPWTRNLVGATQDFDEDYRRLLDKVNALLRAVSGGDETRALMVFSGLKAAAQAHFAREEAQMGVSRHPEVQRHWESHQGLLRNLSSLQFMLSNMQEFASTIGPFTFLDRWFAAHLTTDDKKLEEFVAQRRSPLVAMAA